jgi:hypothetical protein
MRLVLTKSYLAAAALALTTLGAAPARAEPASFVTATCPLTGPGIVICGTVGVTLHELVQLANGKDGFGPNGEIMKVLAVPVKIVDGNIKGAVRESGEVAKVLRATTGISIRDIEQYGVFGGPNSFFRKPFG